MLACVDSGARYALRPLESYEEPKINMISALSDMPAATDRTPVRPLVVIGSSSSELFDYIFGDRPDYFPFWASGWSARGLRSEEHNRYLENILTPVPKEANVFLNFGCVDVNFNCRHMASARGVYDFKTIMDEAADGIRTAARTVRASGFQNIYAVFISPAIPLPQSYWAKFSPSRQLPDRMLGRMYHELFREVASTMKTVDVFNEIAEPGTGTYVMKKEYKKANPNHHPDYIKIQNIVWDKIKDIPGMLPMRSDPLREEYGHTSVGIKKLIESGTTRTRTCR